MTHERNIEVRYNLLDCAKAIISHKLSEEEMLSLLMSECNFDKTTGVEYILATMDLQEYLNKIPRRPKSRTRR